MFAPVLLAALAYADPAVGGSGASPAAAATSGGEEPTAAPAAEVAPAVKGVAELGYAVNGRWVPMHGPGAGPLTGLATVGPAVLVGDVTGAVWRSEDAGITWSVVLRALVDAPDIPDDERLLLEAESLGQEEKNEANDPSVPTSDLDKTLKEKANGRVEAPVVLYAHLDVALAARPDGIWRSDNGGRAWERVADERSARVFATLGNTVAAGTDSGLLLSPDGGVTWIDISDAIDGEPVRALAGAEGALYAGGPDGLYTSDDGLRWSRAPMDAGGVGAILVDHVSTGGLWVATDRGIYRSDDGARNFYLTGGQPMHGTKGMVQFDAGHLLAWGADGAWETMDASVSWQPLNRGLREPSVVALTMADRTPLAALPNGIWRLVRGGLSGVGGLGRRPGSERFGAPPLYEVVAQASNRAGIDPDMLSLARKAALARLLPQFELTFNWDDNLSRDNDWVDEKTEDGIDSGWSITGNLCFGSCGATIITGDTSDPTELIAAGFDEDTVFAESSGDDALFVMDGEVISSSQPVLAAANVASSIQAYRLRLSDVIADTYISRQRLLNARPPADASVSEQIDHQLKVMEAEARLDLYTDGAFGRSLASNTASATDSHGDHP